ncbi:MAG: SRPBCC family protein [Thermonemataceae bacterium]
MSISSLSAQEKQPSNSHFWYSLETTASPTTIWNIWTDVPRWKDWDTGLKDAQMEGKFELNQQGEIISLENRRAKFKITALEEGRSYTYRTKLPFGSLYVKRYLTEQEGKTIFTH